MARFCFGRKSHELNILIFIFFLHISQIHYILEVIIEYSCRKLSIQCNFIIL